MNDLKFAWRQLRQHPGFTLTAVLTLGLGIGANTSVFSVVNGVLLKPLPYPQPGQLVVIRKEPPPGETLFIGGGNLVGGHEFAAWREQSRTLAQIAAYGSDDRSLIGRGQAERVRCGTATPSLFPLLGVKPSLGRLFLPEEEIPNGPRVALLSHGLWQRAFGGDATILDQSITLEGELHTIVGILPAGFQFPDPNEIWVPIQMRRAPEVAGGEVAIHLLRAMARLKPDVSVAQAQAELQLIASRVTLPGFPLMPGGEASAQAPIAPRFEEGAEPSADLPGLWDGFSVPGSSGEKVALPFPGDISGGAGAIMDETIPLKFGDGGRIQLVGLHEHLVANARRSVLVLMAAVGFVLLIACANVANLLLTRAVSRRREIAVRVALGAQPLRIVRQLLTESVLLALAGGGLGLLLGWWGVRALGGLKFAGMAHFQPVGIDTTVLAFTSLLAVGTGLVFGLAPAWRGARVCVQDALKRGSPGTGQSCEGRRLRSLLVISEMAMAFVLLVGAGLLMHSLLRLRSVEPGFQPDGVLVFQLNPGGGLAYGEASWSGFVRRLREELAALPGVHSVAMTDHLPLTPYSIMTAVSVVGAQREPRAGKPPASLAFVTPGYFETLGMAVKQGRTLTAADETARTVVVNERFAREYFPGRSALGERLNEFAGGPGTREIVGIVADTRQDGFDRDVTPEIYTLSADRDPEYLGVAIKFGGDEAALARAVRLRVQALDPSLVLYDLMTLRARLDATTAPRRAMLTLLGGFAALALVLAAVGIYGVMSFTVTQRTREIGVRLALGAQVGDVLRMVVRQGLLLVTTGLSFGLAAALVMTRSLASMLFGVGATDPPTLLAVSLLLLAIGLAACWLPAHRASRIDPMEALRHE